MLARLSTVPSSIQSIWSDASVICQEVAYGASSLYNSETFQHAMVEGWQGLSQAMTPSIVTSYLRSADVRSISNQFFSANIIGYMAPAMTYYWGVKPLANSYFGENSYAAMALDVAVTLYLLRKRLGLYHDNAIYSHAQAKATTRANPEHSGITPCGCEDIDKLQADLFSGLYYLTNYVGVHALEKSIPMAGSFLAIPLRAQLVGQALLESKIASIGLCGQHRHEIIKRNNAYAFGLGLSLIGSIEAWKLIIFYATGVNSSFVTDAVFYSLYQHHMVSTLLIDKPLPGKEEGADVFYYGRLLTDAVLKQVVDDVIPALLNKNPKHDLLTMFKQFINTPLAQVMIHLFLHEDFRSLDNYIERPTVRLFLDINRPVLEGSYQKILQIRKDKFKTLALFLPLPKSVLSDKSRQILTAIKSGEAEQFLLKFNDWLNYLYPDRNVKLKALFARRDQFINNDSRPKAESLSFLAKTRPVTEEKKVAVKSDLIRRRDAYVQKK